MAKIVWDAERIANLTLPELESLRANASRLASNEIVNLCDAELVTRRPKRTVSQPTRKTRASDPGRDVVGFHFVCDRDKGVTQNPDGTFWSGTWVVDERHAVRGLELGAYVALHSSKVEVSYRQGIVRGWRKVEREARYGDEPVKTERGIDFLLEPTNEPYDWIGSGAGEKGYAWSN
jgi:hypothetical protein